MTLKIDLSGVKSLKRKVEAMRKTSVEVGFFPEDVYGPENDNLPVAAVAQMQQLGAGNYPARPFFNDTLDDRSVISTLVKSLAFAAKNMLCNNGNIRVQLTNAGKYLKYEVEQSIDNYPGNNSKWWADFKGKDDPLRYTDKMLNSVKVKIKK